MSVLVADTFEAIGLEGLRAAGCSVLYEPTLQGDALVDRIRTSAARILIVRGTRVTAAALEAGNLGLVVRAGAGYNTIDVAAAARLGIYVANCPGKNAVAVAELTIGLILALDRRIPDNVADLRAGRWDKAGYSKARGLAGRTLGLLGYGQIAQAVARRAAAFDMNVLVWSRRFTGSAAAAPPDDALPLTIADSPETLAARSDILSVHLALSPETRHFVNRGLLGFLRPGAFVINTARAEVVDNQALADMVSSHHLRVAIDVFDDEPAAGSGDFVSPLAQLPGVYGTHHIGASTEQAQTAIAEETVRIVATYLRTGRVPNVVNLATTTPATHVLAVRHRDRPGVLAHVFTRLREAGINVQETENTIFAGAEAAVARIHLDSPPPPGMMARLAQEHPDIIDLTLVRLQN